MVNQRTRNAGSLRAEELTGVGVKSFLEGRNWKPKKRDPKNKTSDPRGAARPPIAAAPSVRFQDN